MGNFKLPISEISFTFSRSSGAGGQNVNKVNSKVTLRWNIKKNSSLYNSVKLRFKDKFRRRINEHGVVLVVSQRYRDQGRNVADAIEKLEAMVEEVWSPPKRRVATKPTKASVRKRLNSKKELSDKKKMRKKNYD
jgi:ribosome-associated protein